MQICGLHRSIYRGARLASRLATKERSDVVERRDAVARWHQARRDGLTASQAAKAVGTPLSTLYRWAKDTPPKSRRPKTTRKTTWTTKLVQAVEEWRLEEPMWGKAKIVVKLREERSTRRRQPSGASSPISSSAERSSPCPPCAGRPTRKWAAKRRFAERLPKSAKATRPGQIVQLDTVYVTLAPGKHVKHFTAYDPVAKWTVAKAYNRATAAPPPCSSTSSRPICPSRSRPSRSTADRSSWPSSRTPAEPAIKLYVLPPKSPQINGAVERCNGSWRYEFYAVYDLPTSVDQLNPLIDAFQHRYNTHRPHGALGGKTPAQYLAVRQAKETSLSHMS